LPGKTRPDFAVTAGKPLVAEAQGEEQEIVGISWAAGISPGHRSRGPAIFAHDFADFGVLKSSRQPDLFQDDVQADLFGEDAPTPVYRADPDTVRQELYKLLAEARAAQSMPWDAKRATLYRTIFPRR